VAELGHIRPWEMARFTLPEARALEAMRDQLVADAKKAARGREGFDGPCHG
jgi:hypothetical protein